MKFYSVGLKKHVDVDDKDCKYMVTKNGKHMAYAMIDGKKLTKFISKAEYDDKTKK